MTDTPPRIPVEITPLQVKVRLDSTEPPLLIDCREPDEVAHCRIEGATHIPMGEIQGRIGELADYRDQPVVVYCHHGGRSLHVVHWLRSEGFSLAQSMAGGIDDWSQEVDSSVPRY